MRSLLVSVYVILILVLFSSPYAAAQDILSITAEVVSAERMTYPDVFLKLKDIVNPSGVDLDSLQKRNVDFEPKYARRYGLGGQVDYNNPITQQNLVAYYLMPGDRISAKLTIRTNVGREYHLLEDMTRVPARPPRKDVAMRSIDLRTDKSAYKPEEPIRFELVVTNTSSQAVNYMFSSGQQFDFWVTRDNKEVWRWSKGRMFTQEIKFLNLSPGESKTFSAQWDQKDDAGAVVPVGKFVAHGQLTTMDDRPAPGLKAITIGAPKIQSVAISTIRANPLRFLEKTVSVPGVYCGWKQPEHTPGCEAGPPITRSDWILSDGKGCFYVTGRSNLSPTDDYGTKITVTGRVKRTKKGQTYLLAEDVKVRE